MTEDTEYAKPALLAEIDMKSMKPEPTNVSDVVGKITKAMDDLRGYDIDWMLNKHTISMDEMRTLLSTLSSQASLLEEARRVLEPFKTDWADENGWADRACQKDRIVDWFGPSDFRAVVDLLSKLGERNEARAKLAEAVIEWQPISTCPIRDAVDLWCVYGGEEFAQYEGGASIGKMVPNRFKTEEYGFFGNQSNEGVPQRNAPDLVPVAWRRAVPDCPPELIAEALGVPLTRDDALLALSKLGASNDA